MYTTLPDFFVGINEDLLNRAFFTMSFDGVLIRCFDGV